VSSNLCLPANLACFIRELSACEGFFGRLKNEMYYHRINTTLDDFMQQVDSYIWWHNQHRTKISLGGLSPAEYRRNHAATAIEVDRRFRAVRRADVGKSERSYACIVIDSPSLLEAPEARALKMYHSACSA